MGADPKGRSSPTSEAPGHDPIEFFSAEAPATAPSGAENGLKTAAARVAAEPLVLINAQPGDALDLFGAEPDDSSPPDAAAPDPLTLFSTEAAPPGPHQTAAPPAPKPDREADTRIAELRIRATPPRPPVAMPPVATRRAGASRVAVAAFVCSLLAVTAVGIAFLVRATTGSTAPPPATATRVDPQPPAIGTNRPSAPNAPVEGTVPRSAAPESPRATPPTTPEPSPRSAETPPPAPAESRAANPADARRPDPLSIQRREATPPANNANVTAAPPTRAAPTPAAPAAPSAPTPGSAPLTPPVAPAGTAAAPIAPPAAVPAPIAPPPAEPAPAVAAPPEPPAAAAAPTSPPARDDRAAPATPSTARETDSDAIQTALDRYRTAFNVLDARAAGAVWPTVDQRALARAFERLERQNLEFANCTIDTRGLRATATCTGTAEYVPKVGSRTARVDGRQWMFVLRKVDQQWLIDAVNSR